MLQAVARSTIELDWHSLGGYNFQEQEAQARRRAMARRQRESLGGGSAQPHNFRDHLGQIIANDSLANPSTSLGIQQTTYTTSPYATATVADNSSHWPPEAATTFHDSRLVNNNFSDSARYTTASWHGVAGPSTGQYQQQSDVPRRSARLPQNQTPFIQISTSYDNFQSQAANQVPLNSDHYLNANSYIYDSGGMADTSNVAPVSPISHHSPHSRTVTPLPEPTARKRSFGELSQGHSPNNHTSPSGYSGVEEDKSHGRKSRTIKRAEAPMNQNRKFVCHVSAECAGLEFDRKCEWGKHMDKHDRPYRCQHASCAKLQGFTYSGGLLRHEREVHNKHGGPRSTLWCPHPNCKRSSEKGFTRKENLQEHVRRVHSEAEPGQPEQAFEQLEPDSALSTGTGAADLYVATALNGTKRKRSLQSEEPPVSELQHLRELVKRLQSENDAKTSEIEQLEEQARQHSMKITMLEQTMQQQHSIR